jgi:hypothetical protein
MDAPAIRASDQDRERAAAKLREHAATGRLDVEELTARLDATFTAKTQDELDAQFRDLPADREVMPSSRHPSPRRRHVSVYLAVSLLMIVIWAATGMGYFWPIWPILGWGVGVVSPRNRARCARSDAARPRPSSPVPR